MELLAPAGDLEKLRAAVLFGADAVYCGGGDFSLRAPRSSFSLDDLAAGIGFAHKHRCRVYLALNIFPRDDHLQGMLAYFQEAVSLGIDGVIISDPGLLEVFRPHGAGISFHLSTQANTTNSAAARFWSKNGVKRIVLARELSLAEIVGVRAGVPDLELEVFVHGAMCMAYSGRCLLSAALDGRFANLGRCSQPCRREFLLSEVESGEQLVLGEEDRGAYLLNSRDLCMIDHLPALAGAGVDSIKIEGRMKTVYYVAVVTRVYRAALDLLAREGSAYQPALSWREELAGVSHRPYGTGFFFPTTGDADVYVQSAATIKCYDFVGVVVSDGPPGLSLTVDCRNRLAQGDSLEVLDPRVSPGEERISYRVERIMEHHKGTELREAHNGYRVVLHLAPGPRRTFSPFSLLRRKQEEGC